MKVFVLLILLVYLVTIDDSYSSSSSNTRSPRLRINQKTMRERPTVVSKRPPTTWDRRRKRGVMFVCAGNVCRSPIAEAVFMDLARKKRIVRRWYADSAGTEYWNVGRKPDRRAIAELTLNGIQYNHTSQLLMKTHFDNFDFMLAMDHDNLREIHRLKPEGAKTQIMLFGSFNPLDKNTIIGDPYYDIHHRGFEKCYNICVIICNAFLDKYQ